MYKIKLSINGIIQEIIINAKDSIEVYSILTNMYGKSNYDIIDIKRI